MNWFSEFDTATGVQRAEGNGTGPATPAPGHTVTVYEGGRPVGLWDAALKDYDGIDRSPRVVTARDFLRLFTTQERIAIRTSDDAVVGDFLFLLQMEPTVNLKSPDVDAGLDYLTAQGLIAAGRKAEILA